MLRSCVIMAVSLGLGLLGIGTSAGHDYCEQNQRLSRIAIWLIHSMAVFNKSGC